MSVNYYTQTNTVWMGVVEDTNDPLKLGRCKVRIFGVHSDNLQEVPTADLPWATPLYPPNTSQNFSVPLEGTFVMGYFPDGLASQAPVITGSVPGFLAKEWNRNKGFSPQSDNPIQTDNPFNQGYVVGIPTIGYAARGDVANTNIHFTNGVVAHGCDFRYFVNFTGFDIGLGELINPITAMQDAVRNGKNKAAMMIRTAMTVINKTLRDVINALLAAVSLDPSGTLSIGYSTAKKIFREINLITKEIAEKVEMVSMYYNLVKDIQQIVDYLKGLPQRVIATIQGCITQFLASIQNFIGALKTIPGIVGSNIESMLGTLNQSTENSLNQLNQQSANVANTTSNTATDLLFITVSSPNAEQANLVMEYINANYANANVTLSIATANSFNIASTQSP